MPIEIMEFTSLMVQNLVSISAFYYSLMFLLKIKRAKGTGFRLSPITGVAMFGLFSGIMYIFWTYYYFILFETDIEILEFYRGAILSGYTSLIGLTYFSERTFGKTKYILTIISLILCIYGIFFLNNIGDLRIFSYITMPFNALVFYIIFFYSLVLKTRGKIRKKMIIAFSFGLGIFFSYILTTNLGELILPLPLGLRLIVANSALLISMIGWGQTFLSFETFTEFGWKEKLKEIFIIAPNGAPFFHYSFIKETITQNIDLVSAGLAGYKDFLAEIVKSEKNLEMIDHRDVKILFEYGTYSTIALVVYENLNIYRSKLTLLSNKFELLFQDILPNWIGEIEVFFPTKSLIIEIFS